MNTAITIFAGIFVLFLPGFMLSLVFFRRNAIDLIERTALSFALSVAIVPLIIFYTNLLGIKITRASVLLQIVGVILICGSVILIRYVRRKA